MKNKVLKAKRLKGLTKSYQEVAIEGIKVLRMFSGIFSEETIVYMENTEKLISSMCQRIKNDAEEAIKRNSKERAGV